MAAHETSLAADLVIFGSGFAAYELARATVGRGRSCVVIERGGESPTLSSPALSRVSFTREPIVSGGFDFGAQVPAAFDGVPRYIGLGGTSELWSGKWRRLDRIDFAREVDGRRWPIAYDELRPFYDEVAGDDGWPAWTRAPADDASDEVSRHGLRSIDIFEQQPPLRLRPKWVDLQEASGLQLLPDAALAEVIADDAGCGVRAVRVRCADQPVFISARMFVVACGGIESVCVSHDLRLACAASVPPPAAYTGFMDHPKAFVGEVVGSTRRSLIERLEAGRTTRQRLIGFSLGERDLETTGIGNHTVFVWRGATINDPLRLVVNLEQRPERGNAVVPDVPARVSWRLSRRTWMDFDAFMAQCRPRLADLLGGTIRLDRYPAFRGASHHAGALPMGDPPVGQVDAQCRFHGTDNVYCLSSAIFPIAGSAHPTMTIVALARRLAAHLSAAAA